MIDVTRDIHSLSDFKRNTPAFLKQLRASGRPLVLTLNGKASLVVMDPGTYQQLLDAVDEVDAIRKIRKGLEDVGKNRIKPARDGLDRIRKKTSTSNRRK